MATAITTELNNAASASFSDKDILSYLSDNGFLAEDLEFYFLHEEEVE